MFHRAKTGCSQEHPVFIEHQYNLQNNLPVI
jgi:hypothetical protein